MADYKSSIKKYINQEIEILSKLDTDSINNVMNAILETYNFVGNIYIFGNGGSASTASHFANDFNKGLSEHLTKKFNFICLNDNIPTLLAIANDIGYGQVFKFQLTGKLKKEDLVIGISGSGNSENIIQAIQYAKSEGVKTIGITGYNGGTVLELCDISLNVPIQNMQITEDIHMMFDHLFMSVFLSGIN